MPTRTTMQTEHVAGTAGTGYAIWKWICGIAALCVISIPVALWALFGLISLNLVVGFWLAFSSGMTCSKRGELRIRAKVLTLLLVALVYIVFDSLGKQLGFNLSLHVGPVEILAGTAVAGFYSINEIKAFMETCKREGVDTDPVSGLLSRLAGQNRRELLALNLKQGQETDALKLKQEQDKGDEKGR